MLPEDKRLQLDGIVSQMVANKESDDNIRFVVDDFKKKYTPLEPPKPQGVTGVKGLAVGLGKESARFVRGLGQIGEKMLSPVAKAIGVEEPKFYRDLKIEKPVGKAEKIGAFAGTVAQFAAPAGQVFRATKVLSFIPRILARAGADAATQAIRTGGDIKEAAEVGGISTGIQTAFAGGGLGLRLLGGIFKNLGAAVSGRGSTVIQEILEQPQAAKEGLRQPVTETLKQDIAQIRNYVIGIARRAQENYRKALEALPEQKLSLEGIKNKFVSLFQKHNVEIDPAKKTLEFLGSTLRKTEENVLREVFSVVNRWKDMSAAGLDRLAVKIGNYIKSGEQSKQLNSMLRELKEGVRDYLGEITPQAKEMVSRFREEKEFLSKMITFLGAKLGPKADPVILKNMAARLGTLFTKNKELAREVLESIPGGTEILGRQAGRELVEPIARSTATIGGLIQMAIQTVLPPKFIGELTAATGIARQKLAPFVSALQKLEATERATLLRVFLGGNQQ